PANARQRRQRHYGPAARHGRAVAQPPAPVVEDHRAERHNQRRSGGGGRQGEPVRARRWRLAACHPGASSPPGDSRPASRQRDTDAVPRGTRFRHSAAQDDPVTVKGSYQPTGGTGIDLPGGSTDAIALPSLGGVPGAIAISSSVPVAAAVLVPGGPLGIKGAIAASSGPVREQGVVADNPARSAGSTELVLSAPGKAASVRITTATSSVSAVGQQGRVVQIKAGSSVVIAARPPTGSKAAQFALVVTPISGSGPVYAGRIITSRGMGQSILPVPSSLTWIPVPVVQTSLSPISATGHSSAG